MANGNGCLVSRASLQRLVHSARRLEALTHRVSDGELRRWARIMLRFEGAEFAPQQRLKRGDSLAYIAGALQGAVGADARCQGAKGLAVQRH